MSAEEFWKDDPQLFVSYRTFYINKKEKEMEEMDYKCWLQGKYIHEGNAILNRSLVQSLHNMFSDRKDSTKLPEFATMPYFQKYKEKQEKLKIEKEKMEKQQKYEEFQRNLVYAGTMKKRYLESVKKQKQNNK